jgi:hypothetical protein
MSDKLQFVVLSHQQLISLARDKAKVCRTLTPKYDFSPAGAKSCESMTTSRLSKDIFPREVSILVS